METLIERMKRFYEDYRGTSDVDESFRSALETVGFWVIESCGDHAERGDTEAIRNLVREYKEIRLSAQGSNDSVKERFEDEYRERHAVRTH
ncbi:hypothetical protein MO973_13700 [Paenibacillus sp. TRM 82003]|nr:hypothetical protein [Paenibacillus sp. TRM 82003]